MRTSNRTAVLAIAVVWMVAACSAGAGASSSPVGSVPAPTPSATVIAAASPTAEHTTAPSKAPGLVVYDGRIAVDGARKLEVRCVGHGTPTILLEGGGINPSLDAYPRAFVNGLGNTTTVCHYSRAGGGVSSALPAPLTMAAFVEDANHMLAALKSEAGIEGPYLFVGWSFGGTVALAEALAHPDTTAGLVILDTDFLTDFMKTCIADGRSRAECQSVYDGDVEAKSMERELVGTVKPLPGIPIQIVNAMKLDECRDGAGTVTADASGKTLRAPDCATLATQLADLGFRGWSTLGPQVIQTRVQATHNGLIDEAGHDVASVILAVLAEARAKDP
jgi:pimeloyl-ACP methyl ester carboxylesterase